MSTTAPWLALASDWMDSEMFDGASQSERLAWVCLLCHVKTMGRAGRAKMRAETFKRTYRLSNRAVVGMMARAQKCKSITVEGDIVTVCNWRAYQDPKGRKGVPNGGSFTKTPGKPTKDATQYPVPSTQKPSTQKPSTQKPPKSPKGDWLDLLPESLSSVPEFVEAWKGWVAYRTERRAKLTKRTATAQIKKFNEIGSERAIRQISLSVENGWQGLFEANDARGNPNRIIDESENYKLQRARTEPLTP